MATPSSSSSSSSSLSLTGACVGPWSGLVILLAAILVVAAFYLAAAAMRLAARDKRARAWREWIAFQQRIAPQLRRAEAVRDALQTVVGDKGRVFLWGSHFWGCPSEASDIDLRVHVYSCDDYRDVFARLQDAGLRYVYTAPKFARFKRRLPDGTEVDATLRLGSHDDGFGQLSDTDRAMRGFLMHQIKRRDGQATIRRDKRGDMVPPSFASS